MYEFSNQREKQYYHFGRLHLGIGVAGWSSIQYYFEV